MRSLAGLYAGDNNFAGPIPAEIGNLTGLQELSVSGNSLRGPLPPELGELIGLTDLRLSTNGLTGTLPQELQNLPSLDLHESELEGTIPDGFQNGPIDMLSLGRNRCLTGETPALEASLTSLAPLVGTTGASKASRRATSLTPEPGTPDAKPNERNRNASSQNERRTPTSSPARRAPINPSSSEPRSAQGRDQIQESKNTDSIHRCRRPARRRPS